MGEKKKSFLLCWIEAVCVTPLPGATGSELSLRVITYNLRAVEWHVKYGQHPTTIRLSSQSIDLEGHLRWERVIFHVIGFALKRHFSAHLLIYLNETAGKSSRLCLLPKLSSVAA